MHRRPWIWLGSGLGLLVLLLGFVVFVRYVARVWVSDVAYEACIESVSRATPQKCRCLAGRMAERMVTPQYVYRRLSRDEGIPGEEMEQMRKACQIS